jgi:hypothetical protein
LALCYPGQPLAVADPRLGLDQEPAARAIDRVARGVERGPVLGLDLAPGACARVLVRRTMRRPGDAPWTNDGERAVPARTPAAGTHACLPGVADSARPASQAAPAPDHLARLQSALATFSELPKPDVLAQLVITRGVDTDGTLRDQLTRANEYITNFARELDARQR